MLFGTLRLFRGAGTTGHVMLFKNGKHKDMGVGWSGFIGLKTTPAVVPTGPQIYDFSVEAQTKDIQQLSFSGRVTVSLNPQIVVTNFDFSTNEQGSLLHSWMNDVKNIVTEKVLNPVRTKALTLKVSEAIKSESAFETAIFDVISKDQVLVQKGINVLSCAITMVSADEDITNALGAKDKELMLTEADNARHERQLTNSKNTRAVREYDADTQLVLAQKKTKLIEQDNANKDLEAAGDAAAIEKRLAGYSNTDAGKLLAIGFVDLAKSGKVGNVNFEPSLVSAVRSTNGG